MVAASSISSQPVDKVPADRSQTQLACSHWVLGTAANVSGFAVKHCTWKYVHVSTCL